MIINTGMRTDIPAFYSKWLINRIREGYVLVRNPYHPELVTRYELDPAVVDILSFCSKNPSPMLPYLDELKKFHQFWFVTVTPYGKDIEPHVPNKYLVLDSFRKISEKIGVNAISLRYDPIFITKKYDLDYHIRAFGKIAVYLEGYTKQAVISFIDLYQKTKHNFPEVREVTPDERIQIGKAFAEIGKQHGITVRSCFEGSDLAPFGIDIQGCMTKEILENAAGIKLDMPKKQSARPGCQCLLGNDIGVYNTCPHLCRYCYANYDKQSVINNFRNHDPDSPLLIGHIQENDIIKTANQYSYISNQISLF